MQASLAIRAIPVGRGIFPSGDIGLTAYSGDDDYLVGELRYFTGTAMHTAPS